MSDIHGFLSALVTKREGTKKQLACMKHNLLTQDGRDVMHERCYISTSIGAVSGFNYIASTESIITPGPTDTALTGEIAVSGLARAQATTRNHTDNSNSSTIEHTFTASGSFTDVKASATFNAASGVTMGHIANFATGSGTLISGDTLKITWTLNLG
jgi:hypothetical protein